MSIEFSNQMKLNDKLIPIELSVATGFFDRLRGLMFTSSLSEYQGMYIAPCADVHSFFMAYPLDLVFLNDDDNVIKLDHLPQSSMRRCPGAKAVVELAQGSVDQYSIKVGDRISYCEQNEYQRLVS